MPRKYEEATPRRELHCRGEAEKSRGLWEKGRKKRIFRREGVGLRQLGSGKGGGKGSQDIKKLVGVAQAP